jgi:hypothetical protein
MGEKKRGTHVSRKNQSRSRKQRESKKSTRAKFLGNPAKTVSKRVGQKKQLRYTAQRFNTNVKPQSLNTPENRKSLIAATKKFRKKYNTTKTRVLVAVTLRRRGKKKLQYISVPRAELGSVTERIDETLEQIEHSLRGYKKQGFNVGHIREIILERVTRAKKKARRR